MSESSEKKKFSAAYMAKYLVCKTSLLALGVTFELTSKYSEDLQRELENWREGIVFSLGVLPRGPYMTAIKEGGRIKYLGIGKKNPEVSILFKNLDAALFTFTGQMGTHTAGAQKRFIVHGNLTDTMKIARGMQWVQAFLFPSIILNKTFKRPPKFTTSQLLTKGKIMAALVPALALNATK